MTDYDDIVRRMIEAAGHASQSAGVGRVLGQIFACLYFSKEPLSLSDLTRELGISKGSASTGVRQLEQWGALERIWIHGDRKDYYAAKDCFGKILKNAIRDLAGRRIESTYGLLEDAHSHFGNADDAAMSDEDRFIADRVEKVKAFQEKIRSMWEGFIVTMLLN